MITGIYIDTASLYKAAKRKYNKKIDYTKLKNSNTRFGTSLTRAYGIRATIESRSFIDILKGLGFETTFIKKGVSLNVDIAIDVCKQLSKLGHVVLYTCDRDLLPLVKFCKDSGILVTVIGINLPLELEGQELSEEMLFDTAKNESNEHLPTNVICNGS